MISYFRLAECWRFRWDTRYAMHTSDYSWDDLRVDASGRRQVPTLPTSYQDILHLLWLWSSIMHRHLSLFFSSPLSSLLNFLPFYTDLCFVFSVFSSFVFFFFFFLFPLLLLVYTRVISFAEVGEVDYALGEERRMLPGLMRVSGKIRCEFSKRLVFSLAPHSNLSLSCLFFIFSRTPFGMLPACFTYWTRVECRRDNDLDFRRWPLANYHFYVLYAA